MSVNTIYPRELEQRQLARHQYCRGCILFLKYANQQRPLLMQQAGVPPIVYGHPVLILATHITRDGLNCVRVAVITSCGGNDPPQTWAHAYLPIWPKAVMCSDAPQLFLGEGRTLPKESYVCLRNTWDFDYSMLSLIWQPSDSYHFHLTRKSFNLVAKRLKYPPMKLLDDPISPEPMIMPPACVNINLTRTAETAYQSNAQEEKQWMQEYLKRRLKNPRRMAQYLAAWEKDNNAGAGRALEPVSSIPPKSSPQPNLALPRDGEDRSSTSPEIQQPVPHSPLSQVNITSSPQSLTPKSVHDLIQRLQTISPPQLTKETHHTTKAKQPRSKNPIAMLHGLELGQRISHQPGATPTLSFYDFSTLTLVLITRAMWFFLKVLLIMTYKIIAWLLLVLASQTPCAIRVWMNEIIAATDERLQIVAAEAKQTVKEVLEQQ